MSAATPRLLAAFVLTLTAGLVLGYWGARAARPPAGTQGPERTYLDRLVADYDLRPEQADRVRAHLEAEGQAIAAILDRLEADVRDEVRGVREQAMAAIRNELTAEQRERFDRDLALPPRENAR